MLEEYENAISYYKDAIKVTLDDKNREASDKSLSVINGAHAYIKLGQYEKSDCLAAAVRRVDSKS